VGGGGGSGGGRGSGGAAWEWGGIFGRRRETQNPKPKTLNPKP